jgi:hypothetical protein
MLRHGRKGDLVGGHLPLADACASSSLVMDWQGCRCITARGLANTPAVPEPREQNREAKAAKQADSTLACLLALCVVQRCERRSSGSPVGGRESGESRLDQSIPKYGNSFSASHGGGGAVIGR